MRAILWAFRTIMLFSLVAAATAQQPMELAPEQPFVATHLMSVPPGAEAQLLAATQEINSAITKAGCADCIYHLLKVAGPGDGPYNYMQFSSWPGRTVYDKVHASQEYIAAEKRHSDILGIVFSNQLYNRYVEVKPVN